MNTPRVLLLFSSSELGGAERSLTRMALAARGSVDFALASLDGPGPWSQWCASLGVTARTLGDARLPGQSHGRFGFRALGRLILLARAERYDAIYVIGLRASLLVRLVKPWLGGARLVQGVRWNPDSKSRLDRAFRLVERLLGWCIDSYICNSMAAANTLRRTIGIPDSRIRVIYNGLAQMPTRNVARTMTVLTVANLAPRKGYIEYLERVVAPLSRRLPEARFVFVGRDEMAGAVQRRVTALGLERVVAWAGFQRDVSDYFASASVFVLPSLWNEGCPTSILEAMAHAVPAVAFALDGIPELVESGGNGILAPLGDYERMEKAIERLLLDPVLVARLGARGREAVMSRFTIEQSAASHALAFAKLRKESRP